MQVEEELSFILHNRPYRETSLLLEIFTKKHGRIGVIAKGVRAPKAKARGLLQAFVPLLISCGGRGELLTLKNFEAAGVPLNLQGRRLVSGFYLNELLMRLLHKEDAHPEVFDCYQETLEKLNVLQEAKEISAETSSLQDISTQGCSLQIILRIFEKKLLKDIGYALQLTKEVETGQPIHENHWYFFDPEKGPTQSVINQGADFDTSNKPQVTRPISNYKQQDASGKVLYRGDSLMALANEIFATQTQLSDAKRLLRQALNLRLGVKPLETRKLLV